MTAFAAAAKHMTLSSLGSQHIMHDVMRHGSTLHTIRVSGLLAAEVDGNKASTLRLSSVAEQKGAARRPSYGCLCEGPTK